MFTTKDRSTADVLRSGGINEHLSQTYVQRRRERLTTSNTSARSVRDETRPNSTNNYSFRLLRAACHSGRKFSWAAACVGDAKPSPSRNAWATESLGSCLQTCELLVHMSQLFKAWLISADPSNCGLSSLSNNGFLLL